MKISSGKKIITFVSLIIFPCLLNAQDTQDTIKQPSLQLTLDKAIEIALSENPTIKVAEQEIQKVDYSKKSAWYNILPSLDASGQYAKYLSPASMAMMGQIINSPTNYTAQGGLQLSLPLFVPALWQSIQMTTLDMQLAVEKAHASKITLRNDVTKAYYGILLAQDTYKTLQNALDLAKDVYQLTEKRFEVGLSSEFDVISAEVQMKNLQPNIMVTENGLEQAKMMLKILMGLEITQPVEVSGNLIDYEIGIDNANALDLSLKANTDLRQLDIQQQQLQKALAIQRTQRMPTLAAFGTYGYQGMANRATEINFGGLPIQVEKSNDWYSQGLLVGLQLNIPLSGIFTNTAKEKQTKIQISQLAMQRDYLEENLNLQVRAALDNMKTAATQAESAKSNEKLAQKAYDISMKRYDTGMGIMLEVQNASQALTNSQLVLGQAIATYLNSKADLDKILGIDNP
ncbi:MAG: TolC family protein [Candidatus Azobacteroides sp.]|nr:TolC family protein [Candidatus Azobacteroides sp.]